MTTYYIKKGRKYVPVAETDPFRDTLPMGHSLIKVYPGGCTYLHNVEPADAHVLAAVVTARKAMIDAMHNAAKLVPDTRNVPEALRKKYEKAWKAWVEVMGEERPIAFQGVSFWDVAQAAIDALAEELDKRKNEKDEELVDMNTGTPVQWVEGQGLVERKD